MARVAKILVVLTILSLVISAALMACAGRARNPEQGIDVSMLRVTEPPKDVIERLDLSPFYGKHVNLRGFAIVGSSRVSDYALLEAAHIVNQLLAGRPDILEALIANKIRLAVMAYDELTTDVPEHSGLKPGRFWDKRARGLGPTRRRPAVSCGEENLLCYPGDPYHKENILIHEFAHAIHDMALKDIDPTFDQRLKQAYDDALEKGLWEGKYAGRNRSEYFAEGVQSFFDDNRENDHDHNHVNTRKELSEYDPALAALIEEVFGDMKWRYRKPALRTGQGRKHLEGYDPAKAPRFAWPAELLEWYRNYEGEQRKKNKKP